MRHTVSILGIPVDNLDNDATLQRLDQFIQEGRFRQIATANADFLINAMRDRELRQILCAADLVTADGMPVVWASHLFGAPLPERVTGADIVPKLAALAANKGYRIYMLGAMPEVAQRARLRMEQDYPGICIVGCVSPTVKLLTNASEEFLLDIERVKPDILLVAFGNPKQEKWIHLHRDRLKDVGVCIGVGGTFDFLAGQTSRAPDWMQRFGLEWLYRLLQEPRRLWRRYVKDLVYFTWYLARQWWIMRGPRSAATANVTSTRIDDCIVVKLQDSFGRPQIADFHRLTEEALNSSPHLVIDIENGIRVDAEALGALVVVAKQAKEVDREVRIVTTDSRLIKILQTTFLFERTSHFTALTEAIATETQHAFQISLHTGDCYAVCNMSGLADFEHVTTVARSLDGLLPSIQQIDIDLRQTSYIDCSMLFLLLSFVRRSAAIGNCVRFAINPIVQHVLEAEKIEKEFVLVDEPLALPLIVGNARVVPH